MHFLVVRKSLFILFVRHVSQLRVAARHRAAKVRPGELESQTVHCKTNSDSLSQSALNRSRVRAGFLVPPSRGSSLQRGNCHHSPSGYSHIKRTRRVRATSLAVPRKIYVVIKVLFNTVVIFVFSCPDDGIKHLFFWRVGGVNFFFFFGGNELSLSSQKQHMRKKEYNHVQQKN